MPDFRHSNHKELHPKLLHMRPKPCEEILVTPTIEQSAQYFPVGKLSPTIHLRAGRGAGTKPFEAQW